MQENDWMYTVLHRNSNTFLMQRRATVHVVQKTVQYFNDKGYPEFTCLRMHQKHGNFHVYEKWLTFALCTLRKGPEYYTQWSRPVQECISLARCLVNFLWPICLQLTKAYCLLYIQFMLIFKPLQDTVRMSTCLSPSMQSRLFIHGSAGS